MRRLVRAALIAALYFSITVIFAPISFPAVQFRISEALCILPLIIPEASVGLSVGCLLANVYGGNPIDIVVGTACTAVACCIQLVVRKYVKNEFAKAIVGTLPHIVINAAIVPLVILGAEELKSAYFATVLSVGLGELTVLFALGIPLYFAVKKIPSKFLTETTDEKKDKK